MWTLKVQLVKQVKLVRIKAPLLMSGTIFQGSPSLTEHANCTAMRSCVQHAGTIRGVR